MKRVIRITGILLGVLVLAAVSLPLLVNANQFKGRIEAALSSAMGRQVTLGDLSFSLFSGSVTAGNLSIADDPHFGTGPFIQAKSLAIGVELWPLIARHELNVTELKITEPAIALI
ncbi:MAG: AsmA family protein [Acidobacteriota bacterium]|nr:AsmA family protein [Acidobacteriota bacterium]